MHRNNILLIINCCEQVYFLSDPSIEVIRHRVLDHGKLSILDYTNNVNQRIQNVANSNQNVLIHCTYGQTRSCSCAIGYFIWKNRWSYDQAYHLVSKQRPVIDIPFEYEQYLREYESQLLRGIVNKSIDKICPNCAIALAIDEDANKASLLAKLGQVSSDICVGDSEVCEGYYGGCVLRVNAFVPESLQEGLETALLELYETDPVRSVNIDWFE